MEIELGFKFEGDAWSVDSFEVPHLQPLLTCMGFSVEGNGRKFVYSGDAGKCESLLKHAKNADLLMHWCYRLDGESIHPEIDELTPTPMEITEIANEAHVKKLVLTHFRVHMDEQEAYRQAKESVENYFSGAAEIAEDLNVYDI